VFEILIIDKVNELQPDGKKTLLGSVIFNIKKDYTNGAVELDQFAVKSNEGWEYPFKEKGNE